MTSKALALVSRSTKAIADYLELAGEVIPAIKSSVPFAEYGSSGGGWSGGGFVASNWPMSQPGSNRDYASSVGNILDNRVVQACVNAKAQAIMEAPPVIQEKQKGKWVTVEDHEIAHLIQNPNAHYQDDHLWAITLASEDASSNGYWRVVFNQVREPAAIWVVSPWETSVGVLYGNAGLSPKLKNYDPSRFIGGYRLWVTGKTFFDCPAAANFELDKDKDYSDTIIHFRPMLNPFNTRMGRSPLMAGLRQIEGDNSGATYHTALLRNMAMASYLVTLKDKDPNITPEQLTAVIDSLERKLTGEGMSRIAGSNLPVDITRATFSPNELSIDTFIAYYEASICALEMVPPMILGLGAGEKTKTYSNMGEAKEDFWLRTIIPLCNRHASEFNAQAIPLFGLDRTKYQLAFDFTKVHALQTWLAKKEERERENWKSGGITLNEFRTAIGKDNKPAYDEVFYKPPVANATPTPQAAEAQALPEGVEEDEDEAVKMFDPTQPRDKDGKWSSGSGGASASSSATRSPMKPATDEDRKRIGIAPSFTDAQVATDPAADLQGTAKNKKGKTVYFYHPDYSKKQAAAKFDRIKAMHQALPQIRDTFNREIETGGKNKNEALILRLIHQTGFRNGGEDGGGDVVAYGASSLRSEHARAEGDKVHFDFIGKEGIRQQHTITDSVLARHVEAQQKAGKETLFETKAANTLAYLKKISPEGQSFKVHDLRTWHGTALAAHVVSLLEDRGEVPTTDKQLRSAKLRVARVVSRRLGNEPKMALDNYIAPQVFQGWEAGIAQDK